jgi:uncharacterized protein (UPF0261 family)
VSFTQSTIIMSTIAVVGTFDTKGEEHLFVAELIRSRGHHPFLIDVGILGSVSPKPDIAAQTVATAGGAKLEELVAKKDRGDAVAAMTRGLPVVLQELVRTGKIDGVISLGGGGGTAISSAGMRALPIGFPKVIVSTMACGNTAPYLGVKDIVLIPSIVDVAGLNQISRQVLTRAAGAICGMVEMRPEAGAEKPVIVASQFGNTTPCVDRARQRLVAGGYEVLVFAATGQGGRTMESIIEAGWVTGVLDITTTEWADELVGGVLNAGPTRLEPAALLGVPAIITPGCLDMVNFGPRETVPAKFNNRTFYQHNAQVTLMRTNAAECEQLGRILAQKMNMSVGPVTVLIPTKGISMISVEGGKFYDAAADEALFSTLKRELRSDIPVVEMNCAINDPEFADACVEHLLENIRRSAKSPR